MAAERSCEVAAALGLIVAQEPHLLQAYIATLSVSGGRSTSCIRSKIFQRKRKSTFAQHLFLQSFS